jgi:hypothetical protein
MFALVRLCALWKSPQPAKRQQFNGFKTSLSGAPYQNIYTYPWAHCSVINKISLPRSQKRSTDPYLEPHESSPQFAHHSFKIPLNSILPNGLFTSGFWLKCCASDLFNAHYTSCLSNPCRFYRFNNMWWRIHSIKFIMQFPST